jgi:hypothetical protein
MYETDIEFEDGKDVTMVSRRCGPSWDEVVTKRAEPVLRAP